jgi:hypothetical protein
MGAAAGPNIIIALNNGPLWVRNLARAMVVVHVLAAYQVYTHPVGGSGRCCLGLRADGRTDGSHAPGRRLVETAGNLHALRACCAGSLAAAGRGSHAPAPHRALRPQIFDWIETGAGRIKGLSTVFHYGSWPSRLGLRTAYVSLLTLVAILVPFFGDLMALIGAIAITPTTYLLPPLLWLLLKKPTRWGAEWLINVGLVLVTGTIGLMGTISSVYLLVTHAKEYRILAA